MFHRRALLLLMLAGTAHAEVKQSAADSFLVTFSHPVSATPTKVYAAITQPQLWWSSEHTWSGKASNLSLKAEAGGCFCERWKDGSVEHGRVIMALPGKVLRLDSALGPLQEFSLKGTLSFWLKPGEEGATVLTVEYRVDGSSGSGLDKFAAGVDEVLGAQVDRLLRYVASGNPEAPPPTAVKDEGDKSADRAAIFEEWKRQAQDSAAKAPVDPPAKVQKKPSDTH